jgi:hypothetical protein
MLLVCSSPRRVAIHDSLETQPKAPRPRVGGHHCQPGVAQSPHLIFISFWGGQPRWV